jgi:hypothetical protein
MNSASLRSLAGRYENPIPPQCLAPIDFLKIPALGPYAGVDYNLQSRLQYIYHGQPYTRLDFIPQKGALDLASEV